MKIHYNPKLKDRARKLRQNATYTERLLWKYLKNRQLHGCQFTRQKPIDNYIVDFYCSKLGLVIEIDGITHDGKQKYDNQREKLLKYLGLEVLRFDGFYVINNINATLNTISDTILRIRGNTTP